MKKATISFPGSRDDVQVYITPGLTIADLLAQLDLPAHSNGLVRKTAPKEQLPAEATLEEVLRGSITHEYNFEVIHLRSDISSALCATPLSFSPGTTTPLNTRLSGVSFLLLCTTQL